MTSSFDPSVFLDAQTTEALVRRPPLPAGQDFQATISKLSMREWQGKEDPTQSGIALDLTLEIDLNSYPDVKKVVGADKVSIVDGFILNTNEGGMIDWSVGKNSKLRRYREALDMNTAGQPFSIRMMEGRTVRAKIKHEPYQGEIFDKIDSVAKA
jgi:hypothetical protein